MCCYGARPFMKNCTISENAAIGTLTNGGALYSDSTSSPTLSNCILWGNTPDEVFDGGGAPVFAFSNIEGGWPGVGNIGADPIFRSFRGFEFLLAPQSPCVDTGDPAIEDRISDWHPRWPDWYPNGPRSDMGAYGGFGNIGWLP